MCEFSVCFFLRPQSEGLYVWLHSSLWTYIFLSYFLGCETQRWARPCPEVTFFNNVYSASRDSSHWNCCEKRPNMHWIPPILCYVLRKMRYLYNGLMVPVGLLAFWNATKHGLCASFKQRYSFCSGHLFKQVSAFLCSSFKEDQSPHQVKVYSDKHHVWLKSCA